MSSCSPKKVLTNSCKSQHVQKNIFDVALPIKTVQSSTYQNRVKNNSKKIFNHKEKECQTYILEDRQFTPHLDVSKKYIFNFDDEDDGNESKQKSSFTTSYYTFIMYLLCYVIIFTVLFYYISPTNLYDYNPRYIFFPLMTLFFLFYTK